MKNIRLPSKSIFGFKVLNSFHSSLFAYFFLLIRFLFINLYSKFGNLSQSSIASSLLFILIINFSIFILILNSILKKEKDKLISWFIFNIFLLIYLPFLISNTIYFLKNIFIML